MHAFLFAFLLALVHTFKKTALRSPLLRPFTNVPCFSVLYISVEYSHVWNTNFYRPVWSSSMSLRIESPTNCQFGPLRRGKWVLDTRGGMMTVGETVVRHMATAAAWNDELADDGRGIYRYIPATIVGPATLLQVDGAIGPYRNSASCNRGRWTGGGRDAAESVLAGGGREFVGGGPIGWPWRVFQASRIAFDRARS